MHVTAQAPPWRQPLFRHSLRPSVDGPIRCDTPGGTRTRSFRVEGPASSPVRPRGRESSGGRARTCDLAGNNRASSQLDHTGTEGAQTEGEGVEPPKPRKEAHPFSRRDTAPVAVLPEVAPAGIEPAPTRVRTGSSAG